MIETEWPTSKTSMGRFRHRKEVQIVYDRKSIGKRYGKQGAFAGLKMHESMYLISPKVSWQKLVRVKERKVHGGKTDESVLWNVAVRMPGKLTLATLDD